MSNDYDYAGIPIPKTPDEARLERIRHDIESAPPGKAEEIKDARLADDEKLPRDFTYLERRAQLYEMVKQKADPRNLDRSQIEFAAHYDVCQKTISNDLQAIRDYIGDTAGELAIERTELLAHDTIERLRDEGEYRDAWRTHREYIDWLFDAGYLDKAPDEISVELDAKDAYLAMLEQTNEDDS